MCSPLVSARYLAILAVVGTIVIWSIIPGCAKRSQIVGTWIGESPYAEGWVLVLREDGTATWSMQTPDFSDAFELTYRFDDTVSPHQFDLMGFDHGMLEGQTLFGILEFKESDSFWWDAEPGSVGNGDRIRPTVFVPDQFRIMTRKTS